MKFTSRLRILLLSFISHAGVYSCCIIGPIDVFSSQKVIFLTLKQTEKFFWKISVFFSFFLFLHKKIYFARARNRSSFVDELTSLQVSDSGYAITLWHMPQRIMGKENANNNSMLKLVLNLELQLKLRCKSNFLAMGNPKLPHSRLQQLLYIIPAN